MLISIVIRTLNEEQFLEKVLSAVSTQVAPEYEFEVVIVDSGSTDQTLNIAAQYGCRITHIPQSEFSFGRSLNIGCEFARGDVLVFLSGHCVPVRDDWLVSLLDPLEHGICDYTYGRQIGWGPTKFSESRVFLKYFPEQSLLPQDGFFANNANAAILRETWAKLRFDEELTGLEDMHLAKRMVAGGKRVGYVAEALVYHIHDETWGQVKNRYEREGLALAAIMPEATLDLSESLRATVRGIAKDCYAALRASRLTANICSIFAFRMLQYWGSYRGTSMARVIARSKTRSYFYPDQHFSKPLDGDHERSRVVANESSQ